MNAQETPLGSCPRCGARIAPRHRLIEYETPDGSATYAECPDCRAVVHPA